MSVMQERAVKPHKAPLARRLYDQRFLFLLMLPALVWVILICYAPMTGLYMAFTNYKPTKLGYWHDLTSPILLALMLNEVQNAHIKKFIQTASYLPYFISWVIAANIFLTFLSSNGLVNDLLMALGLTQERILFFQDGPTFWWIIAIANTWKSIGYNAIIYLSAISGIEQQLYEAADVDGANRVQKMLHITLPAILPQICVLLILAIGGILSTGFEQQLLMGNNAILDYSDVLDTYAYRYGLTKGMYSYGTAVGLFKSIVSFILVMSANKITAKLNGSALF